MLFQTESGQTVGPIGQGTWYLGEDPDRSMPNALLRAGCGSGDGTDRHGGDVRGRRCRGAGGTGHQVWTGTSSFW